MEKQDGLHKIIYRPGYHPAFAHLSRRAINGIPEILATCRLIGAFMRFFNTAGPVKPAMHYCIDPLQRLGLPDIELLLTQQKYFVFHAPRQTGKTSCLLALMEYLNRQGNYQALYVNVEAGQAARENVDRAMRAILSELGIAAYDYLGDNLPNQLWPEILERSGGEGALSAVLGHWAKQAPRPLVLMLDEIDSLVGDTLISVLRQLRVGYTKRPENFPSSVILCGVRDVQDYRIHTDKGKAVITGGSAFNIKSESLRLGNFTREEMIALYKLHTEETGQAFTPDSLELAWELSCGQPWLVNALAYETCFKIPQGRDRSRPITAELMLEAKENLILRRETHLDQLTDKLQEERVRLVLEPLLQSGGDITGIKESDVSYVEDLGLIRRQTGGKVEVANGIYQEIIPRELSWSWQMGINQETVWYLLPDGRLDTNKLLAAFQDFFREHSEHWVERFQYREAGPQLLLQAFLQRVINGGGRIHREYGFGRGRTDLLLEWPLDPQQKFLGPFQRVIIELKILHKTLKQTLADGLAQTTAYMDRCRESEAHLIIFDRRPEVPWEEKIWRREEQHQGRRIIVWGM